MEDVGSNLDLISALLLTNLIRILVSFTIYNVIWNHVKKNKSLYSFADISNIDKVVPWK